MAKSEAVEVKKKAVRKKAAPKVEVAPEPAGGLCPERLCLKASNILAIAEGKLRHIRTEVQEARVGEREGDRQGKVFWVTHSEAIKEVRRLLAEAEHACWKMAGAESAPDG